MDVSIPKYEALNLIIRLSMVSAIAYFSVKWMMERLDPNSKTKKKAKAIAEKHLKRLFSHFNKPFHYSYMLYFQDRLKWK